MPKTGPRPKQPNKPSAEQARRHFLKALEGGQTVIEAAEGSGFTRVMFYKWRKAIPGFADDWDDALASNIGDLETQAYKIAMDINHPGSTKLLVFLLEARDPERYCARTRAKKFEALYRAKANDDPGKGAGEAQREALHKILAAVETAKGAEAVAGTKH